MATARTTDPPTSHLAAEKAELTAPGIRQICLAEVKRNPGQTAAEIAASVGIDPYAASRRLPELEKAGLVHKGESRICRVKNSKCTTWLPGPKPDGQLELF